MLKDDTGINAGIIRRLLLEKSALSIREIGEYTHFALLSLLIALSLFKVNAQASVSGGVKMEANIHEFWLYDLDDYTSKIKIAPNSGCFLEIELNDKFAIQPEVMFFFRNSEIRHGSLHDDFQQWGMTFRFI